LTDFLVFTPADFRAWLFNTKFKRPIRIIQNHHTLIPSYHDFDDNHQKLLKDMRDYHIGIRHFSGIGQNLTTFPDGKIAICRPFDIQPAGVIGANHGGIAIEHLGNFDADCDKMTPEHQHTILLINRYFCDRFNVQIDTDHIVYHAWYNGDTGSRDNPKAQIDKNHKSCPGTAFFCGNSVEAAKKYFIPEIEKVI